MAPDQLWLIVLFVGIPLIEWLIRRIRARGTTASGERISTTGTKPPDAQAPTRRPGTRAAPDMSAGASRELPAAVSMPSRPSMAPPLAPLDNPASRRPSLQGRLTQKPAFTTAPVSAANPRKRVRHGGARIFAGADLRHGFILMAVLGPCRAIAPEDSSQPG
jgi:hypothetical protein